MEVTTTVPGWIGLRDSKLGDASPLLAFTLSEWRAMLAVAPCRAARRLIRQL
ncbi:MAG: DUF397 domain-containing protein [Pseudonocardiaceae bacterium]|nr:DUF397 domain-containing protein [Pseudonocardiaceae bacterium]